MKVLVTGASGLLGRATVERLKADGNEVIGVGLTRSTSNIIKLDLTDEKAVDAFLEAHQPQAIVHTAAERRPDVVENSPEASRVLNVEVPSHLAKWCKERGDACPLLINISTDYVFDGTTPPYKVDDAPNPLNAYGMSKWQGEKGVAENGKPGRAASMRVPVLCVMFW
jgi:sorting nexin-1/2